MTKPFFLFLILLTPVLLSAQGYFYSEGTVTVNNSASVEIKGNIQLEKEIFGNGLMVMNGDNPQMASGSQLKMNNLKVSNSADVFLENDLYINDSLLMNSGVIYTEDKNIFMADDLYHSGNSIGYVITNGNGRVFRKIDNNSFTFHIGFGTEYFPFTITESGTTDTFNIAGWDLLPDDGTSTGTAINSHVALLGYNVQDNNPGGNNLTIQMQWKDSKNAADFVQPYSIGIFYNGLEYEELDNCPTNVITVNPNVVSYSGINHVGTFGIGDSIYLSNIPEASINPDDTSICSGSQILFTASPSNADGYSWSTGDSTDNITVSLGGIYFVDIMDSTGCVYRSNEVSLTLLSLPSVPSISQTGNQLSVPAGYTTYQWLLNGDTLTGAINNTFNPTLNGDYSVLVTGPNGCSIGSDEYNYINLGVDNNDLSSLLISGGEDQIYINGSGNEIYDIRILDVSGKLIYTGKVANGPVYIPVATGIYIINIFSVLNSISKKVIIQ